MTLLLAKCGGQCTYLGWDVGVVTQKGDTKKVPANAPAPKKNSIEQLERAAIEWADGHTGPTQDCGDTDCSCGDDDDIDWEEVKDKNGNPVSRTIPISKTWEETVQGPSGPVTYTYTSSGTVVLYKKRGTSECFPKEIISKTALLFLPEYDVALASESRESFPPELAATLFTTLKAKGAGRAGGRAGGKPATRGRTRRG